MYIEIRKTLDAIIDVEPKKTFHSKELYEPYVLAREKTIVPDGLNEDDFVDAGAKLIVDEARKHKYKIIEIRVPYSFTVKAPTREIGVEFDTICDFIVRILNHDYDNTFLDLVLNPADSCLERIIVIVDDYWAKKEPYKKLMKNKEKWSKARRLSFVVDALDPELTNSEVGDRHFISDYYKYLNRFYFECKDNLLTREKNILIAKYGENWKSIIDEATSLSKSSSLISEVRNRIKNTDIDFFKNATVELFYEEMSPKILEKAVDILNSFDPQFLLLKHLVPDEKFFKVNLDKKRKSIEQFHKRKRVVRGKKKRPKITHTDEEKKKIDEDCKKLTKIISKTIVLSKTDSIPVRYLERFWGDRIWYKMMSGKYSAWELAVDLVTDFYGGSPEHLVYRKKTKKPTDKKTETGSPHSDSQTHALTETPTEKDNVPVGSIN